jgi:hypothetical protein
VFPLSRLANEIVRQGHPILQMFAFIVIFSVFGGQDLRYADFADFPKEHKVECL